MIGGKLDKYITIEKYTQTGTGNMQKPVGTWGVHKKTWANIKQTTADETNINQLNAVTRGHTITIRIDTTINETMEITYKDKRFGIAGVVHDDETRSTTFTAREKIV